MHNDGVHAVPKPERRKKPHRDIPPKVKRFVDLRDRQVCQMPGCGKPANNHHHVDGKGMGGTPQADDPDRLVLLCWW